MYLKCFHVDLALQVLESELGSNNDAFCYNSVLNALVESQRWAEAVDVLGRMVDECVVWDSVTYDSVMGFCGQIRDLRLGLQVHAQLLKGGLMFDVFVGSKLVDMYGKCGDVLNARKVFDDLQNRNVVVWTSLMTAYLQNGDFEETLNLLTCMDQEGTMANEFTFAVLLNACAGIAALKHGDILHGRVEKLGFKNRVVVGNALINMYSKSGSIDSS
ncbi:pentatricopeptide repeat-containing protein, partial [Trifolium medium]|nr:pentatricopeptide repeat-containing protein [Trifolium medium]